MRVPKVWGEEVIIVNDPVVNYCGKLLRINQQHCCSRHMHHIKDETFYVNKGKIYIEVGDNLKGEMIKGDSVRITPGTYHQFTGITDAEIIEFSTFHKDEDTERLEGKLGGMVSDEKFKNMMTYIENNPTPLWKKRYPNEI